jgi:hypothetical protein
MRKKKNKDNNNNNNNNTNDVIPTRILVILTPLFIIQTKITLFNVFVLFY